MQSLKCQNCGSTNIEILKDKMTCNHCGASFVTPKIEITNITNITRDNQIKEEKYEVKTNYDEDVFFKKAMTFLAMNRNVGKDIFNATFEKPKKDYKFISVVDCDCDMSYSLSMGIEQRVKKQVEETFLDRRSNKYRTHVVDKWVTETKWEPYSGRYSNLVKSVSIFDKSLPENLKEKLNSFDKIVSPNDIIRAKGKEEYPEISVAQLDEVANYSIKKSAYAYKDYIKIENYKNLQVHEGTAHIGHLVTYKVPIYSLDFKYNGNRFTIYSLGNDYTTMTIEGIVDAEKEDLISDFNTRKDKIHKPINYGIALSSVIFTIVALIYAFTSFDKSSITTLVIWFVINVVACIVNFAISKADQKQLKSRVSEYEDEAIREKKSLCKKFCVGEGYPEPTESEFKEFYQEVK